MELKIWSYSLPFSSVKIQKMREERVFYVERARVTACVIIIKCLLPRKQRHKKYIFKRPITDCLRAAAACSGAAISKTKQPVEVECRIV
jgi:hypothetical protein